MEQDIAVTTKRPSERVVAFDILRGYFLVVILINHIELYPSGFDFFTGRGRLLVSAAEGFFFMSGLLVGMVYRRRIHLGMRFIFQKMWSRALQLYVGSVVLTLLFAGAAIYLNHPTIKDGLFDVVGWKHVLTQTLLMRYGFGWADFLDRFAILMFIAPFSFYLLVKRKWWLLLGASLSSWAARGVNFTLAWQIIFTLGMIGGYYWNEIRQWARHLSVKAQHRIKKSLVGVAAITFGLSYASVFLLSKLNQHLLGSPQTMPLWLQHFTLKWNTANEFVWRYSEKWTMGPVRVILFLIWFSVLFMLANRYRDAIGRFSRGYLELLGRNSLFVYIAHAFIVFIFKFFIPHQTTLPENFLITAAALAALILSTVAYTAWLKRWKELKSSKLAL